jgi:4-hydroxythreonine-4-phosphate dehydrogenase
MSAPAKPLLAITMGDPAGVGPEVIVGAWTNEQLHSCARLLVVGHPEFLRRAARLLDHDCEVVEIESPEAIDDRNAEPQMIPCINPCASDVLEVAAGVVDPRAGEAAYQAVRLATQLALHRKVDAIVTAPLSKAALHAAGHMYPGHTELLAELCGAREFAMMLYLSGGPLASAATPNLQRTAMRPGFVLADDANPNCRPAGPAGLGVVHVTLHQALRSVFANLTPDAILSKCRLADGVMRRLGVSQPRLAVCALNPHAGEDGLFGDEERTIIAPAVEAARRAGLDVSGPYPTDTLMVRARAGEFDAVVAMYHDQGHIALKLMGMHAAVNITLGLPIVRTSVAHGTAFDRAWQGTARADGMIAAILAAVQLTQAVAFD